MAQKATVAQLAPTQMTTELPAPDVSYNGKSRRAKSFVEAIESLEAAKPKISNPDFSFPDPHATHAHITGEIKKLKSKLDSLQKLADKEYYKVNPEAENEPPALESTTLWDFPKQNYGTTKKGDSGFQGVTPAFIIYNMVKRYTNIGDLVLDPMCGSGTTIDVCREEGREVIGFDISPTRPDIKRNDSRNIPLESNSIDMAFIDSPYGDNVDYSDDPENIGKISAEDEEFYSALGMTASELYRVLKPGKTLGWLIGDQWVKRKFTPVGFNIYNMLTESVGFVPVDLICVTRRNQSSNTGIWHYRAVKHNFFLRGFKHLIIVRKPETHENVDTEDEVQHKWKRYKPELESQRNNRFASPEKTNY